MPRCPNFEAMAGADFRRERLLSRTKANLVDLFYEALDVTNDQSHAGLTAAYKTIKERDAEILTLKKELQDRKEAAHFEPVDLDGAGERALRALSIVLYHGRDEVVKDLTEELVCAHQATEMSELGENAVGPILLLVNPFLRDYPTTLSSITNNTMTVRRYIKEVQDSLNGAGSLARMGVV